MKIRTLGSLKLKHPLRPGLPSHVAAASGLVKVGSWLHIIPDDALALTSFPWNESRDEASPQSEPFIFSGYQHPLFPDPPLSLADDECKRLKPDLESLALANHLGKRTLLAVGSGSTSLRNRGIWQPLSAAGTAEGSATIFDLSSLYEALPFRELNIEGLAIMGDYLYLGQRGNSSEGRNALIALDLKAALQASSCGGLWTKDLVVSIQPLDLGHLHGVRLSLTDLSPFNDHHLLFSAAAEDTSNPYEDGAIAGSALGLIDCRDHSFKLQPMPGVGKVEGIEAIDPQRVLMVTDGDDPLLPASLLEASNLDF